MLLSKTKIYFSMSNICSLNEDGDAFASSFFLLACFGGKSGPMLIRFQIIGQFIGKRKDVLISTLHTLQRQKAFGLLPSCCSLRLCFTGHLSH